MAWEQKVPGIIDAGRQASLQRLIRPRYVDPLAQDLGAAIAAALPNSDAETPWGGAQWFHSRIMRRRGDHAQPR